jgi:hypothetical protein
MDGSVLSRLKVDVNEIGNAYLTLAKYYAEGRDDEVDDPGHEDKWDDEDIDAGFAGIWKDRLVLISWPLGPNLCFAKAWELHQTELFQNTSDCTWQVLSNQKIV